MPHIFDSKNLKTDFFYHLFNRVIRFIEFSSKLNTYKNKATWYNINFDFNVFHSMTFFEVDIIKKRRVLKIT